MLKNAHLLANIGADIVENKQNLPKCCQQFGGAENVDNNSEDAVLRAVSFRLGTDAGALDLTRRSPEAASSHRGRRDGKRFAIRTARSRLYQNEILQLNMRLRAFFKLYEMCTLLHCSKLNSLAKNRFKIQHLNCS